MTLHSLEIKASNSAISSKSRSKSKHSKNRRVQFTEVYDSRSISDMKKERVTREVALHNIRKVSQEDSVKSKSLSRSPQPPPKFHSRQ